MTEYMTNLPHPKKSLGQHFLTCNWALTAIINAAHLSHTDTVLEIGPGTGILTRALVPHVKKIIAIEKDETLADALTHQLKNEKITNVDIHQGDILRHALPLPAAYKVVANIPYYLTARLLRFLLEEQRAKPISITIMIQKEVAERIVACPPHENLLAISVQVFSTPHLIITVPASCFAPQPRVDSAILSLSDISNNFFVGYHINQNSFFQIVRLGFSQKRKMLINSLASLYDKSATASLFHEMNINIKARPEELTLNQWALLVQKLSP